MESREQERPLAGRMALIADDDEAMRDWLRIVLQEAGASVEEADSGVALLARLASGQYDLVVSDVRMSWASGAQALAMARAAGYRMPFVLVTAYGTERLGSEVRGAGVALLEKPLEAGHLVALAVRLIAQGPVPRSLAGPRERAGRDGAPSASEERAP